MRTVETPAGTADHVAAGEGGHEWIGRAAQWTLYASTVVAYIVGGLWLYAQWRVPIANVGLYAQGIQQIAMGHLDGFNTIISNDMWSEAGEVIAYAIAPVYRVFGIDSLWLIFGLSVAVSEWLMLRIAREHDLAAWQQAVLVGVVASNPFVIMNFLTSWDFDILFMPAMLALYLVAQRRPTARVIAGVIALTMVACTVKDETPVLIAFWALTGLVFGFGRRGALCAMGLSAVAYYVGLQVAMAMAGHGDPQIGVHFASIGGQGGISGVLAYMFAHPLDVIGKLYGNRSYFFDMLGASGGAIILDGAGIVAWAVSCINALGSGPLGSIMVITWIEFTLLVVPFLFLALVRSGRRHAGTLLPYQAIAIALYTIIYFAVYVPPFLASPAALPTEIRRLDAMERWYWGQSPRPAFYGENTSVAHFLGSPVVGEGVNSLRLIAGYAATDHLPLVIAYDSQLQGAVAPQLWPTRLAGLLAMGDLRPIAAISAGGLHAYYLDEHRFLSQNLDETHPSAFLAPSWLWSNGQTTLMMTPGWYTMSAPLKVTAGGTATGTCLDVPASSVGVTLSGAGTVAIYPVSTGCEPSGKT